MKIRSRNIQFLFIVAVGLIILLFAVFDNDKTPVSKCPCTNEEFCIMNPNKRFWQNQLVYSSSSKLFLINSKLGKTVLPFEYVTSIEYIVSDEEVKLSTLYVQFTMDEEIQLFEFENVNTDCVIKLKLLGNLGSP